MRWSARPRSGGHGAGGQRLCQRSGDPDARTRRTRPAHRSHRPCRLAALETWPLARAVGATRQSARPRPGRALGRTLRHRTAAAAARCSQPPPRGSTLPPLQPASSSGCTTQVRQAPKNLKCRHYNWSMPGTCTVRWVSFTPRIAYTEYGCWAATLNIAPRSLPRSISRDCPSTASSGQYCQQSELWNQGIRH